jgi:hypothetical protein
MLFTLFRASAQYAIIPELVEIKNRLKNLSKL